jgi:hypothetical protein
MSSVAILSEVVAHVKMCSRWARYAFECRLVGRGCARLDEGAVCLVAVLHALARCCDPAVAETRHTTRLDDLMPRMARCAANGAAHQAADDSAGQAAEQWLMGIRPSRGRECALRRRIGARLQALARPRAPGAAVAAAAVAVIAKVRVVPAMAAVHAHEAAAEAADEPASPAVVPRLGDAVGAALRVCADAARVGAVARRIRVWRDVGSRDDLADDLGEQQRVDGVTERDIAHRARQPLKGPKARTTNRVAAVHSQRRPPRRRHQQVADRALAERQRIVHPEGRLSAVTGVRPPPHPADPGALFRPVTHKMRAANES